MADRNIELSRLNATKAVEFAARAQVPQECPDCSGRGRFETGEMEKGCGGWGFQSFDCEACDGTGQNSLWDKDLISRAGVLAVLEEARIELNIGHLDRRDPYDLLRYVIGTVEVMDSACLVADRP